MLDQITLVRPLTITLEMNICSLSLSYARVNPEPLSTILKATITTTSDDNDIHRRRLDFRSRSTITCIFISRVIMIVNYNTQSRRILVLNVRLIARLPFHFIVTLMFRMSSRIAVIQRWTVFHSQFHSDI